VNSDSGLAIGILDGVKTQPGDVVFIAKPLRFGGKIGRLSPIEPGTMETGRHAAAMAALPTPEPLNGEISWPGFAAWPGV
jgi:hypothetical protein